MLIATVKEVMSQESRVGLSPAGVAELVGDGHEVIVESGAGKESGFDDDAYTEVGARTVDRDEAWGTAELMIKVKEPQEQEYGYLREGLTLFTYLHLAAARPLTEALLEAGTVAIAYETVQDESGLPLLSPMSEIAGRLAAHAAASQLTTVAGGPGMLLGGAPGVAPCRVLVIGGGVVGTQAAMLARGMQADVTVLDTSAQQIRHLDTLLAERVRVLMSDSVTVEDELARADVVIGAVLIPGGAAPKVVSREQLGLLKPGSLLIDVAIDQGGAFETSRPTTYEDPVFEVDEIRHYCVANMPSAVPQTATRALTNATLPYIRRLAESGVEAALEADPALAHGLNVRDSRIVHPGVAEAFPDLPGPQGE